MHACIVLIAILAVVQALPHANVEVPDSVRSIDPDILSPFKNHSSAISAIGALAAQVYIKTGRQLNISEIILSHCAKKCREGLPSDCFDYIKENGGFNDGDPSDNVKDPCVYDSKRPGLKVSGYVTLPPGDEKALLEAVGNVGPVSVLINADGLKSYRGGVFAGECDSTYVNYAALVVGYGKDYWTLAIPGRKEPVLFAANKNQCGIASRATYPIVA